MNKNLGSLIFLAGILLLAGVALLLLSPPPAPRMPPGYAPPSAPRVAQLEEELKKTQAALERINVLDLPPSTAGQPSFADVFPPLADASGQTGVSRNAPGPFETGYSVPINRNERAGWPVTPPPSVAQAVQAAQATRSAQAARSVAPGSSRSVQAAPAVTPESALASLRSMQAAVPGSTPSTDAAPAPETLPPPPGRLAMTYIAPDLKRAIVGDRVVHVGDALENGSRVLAINDSYVTLRDTKGQHVRLSIGREGGETPAAAPVTAPAAVPAAFGKQP
ncbi:hypothetical protein AGMMS50256_19840 [Betaproteobacteria bacterium]|nr:hypothetical protein AGMMS50256_19840 [Betaproteobacteria bacterium]